MYLPLGAALFLNERRMIKISGELIPKPLRDSEEKTFSNHSV
jgi:hypothetical protein